MYRPPGGILNHNVDFLNPVTSSDMKDPVTSVEDRQKKHHFKANFMAKTMVMSIFSSDVKFLQNLKINLERFFS